MGKSTYGRPASISVSRSGDADVSGAAEAADHLRPAAEEVLPARSDSRHERKVSRPEGSDAGGPGGRAADTDGAEPRAKLARRVAHSGTEDCADRRSVGHQSAVHRHDQC